jgi:hypothetical protein
MGADESGRVFWVARACAIRREKLDGLVFKKKTFFFFVWLSRN